MFLPKIMIVAATTLLATQTMSQPIGDASRGKNLATTWCTSCHLVDQSGADLAPSFGSIAVAPGLTDANIRDWLIDPHDNMPPFNLSEDEIRDIIAYLNQLRIE